MADIEIDFEGFDSIEERLQDIDEQGESTPQEVAVTAEYAPPLEFGTRHMPPYPFFRPAIREARLDVQTLLRRHQRRALGEFETLDELVLAVAESLKSQMQNNVRAELASGRRSPGTHPDHPQVQTGNLLNSITRRPL